MKAPQYILFFLLVLASCVPPVTSKYLTSEGVETLTTATTFNTQDRRRLCRDWSSYLPDTNHLEHSPMRYIRVNFHWMNTSDSIYTPGEFRAREYSLGLVRAANYALRKNKQMYLPHGNNTPVLPIQVRLVLTPDPGQPGDDGIYFHYDDEMVYHVHRGKNRTIGKRDMYDKYGVQKDSVLNVFILPHHPDSVDSPTYRPDGGGVALGNFIKLVGVYEQYKGRESYWDHRSNLNHEIAHIYGLSHAWNNDGCDDTPEHVQDCFHRSQSAHCDTATSNNIMDYVSEQAAYTPCQIGRMHFNMSRLTHRGRKFVLPAWCELKDSMQIQIQDTIVWNGAKDLEGHLIIEPGGMLVINCRVSMPPGGKIIVKPGGSLVLDEAHLHNDCGQQWKGIEVQEQQGIKGSVVFVGEQKLENMEFPLE